MSTRMSTGIGGWGSDLTDGGAAGFWVVNRARERLIDNILDCTLLLALGFGLTAVFGSSEHHQPSAARNTPTRAPQLCPVAGSHLARRGGATARRSAGLGRKQDPGYVASGPLGPHA